MTLQTTSSSNRIEAIDVLRGFTLFGIVLVHMVEQYYAGPYPEGVQSEPTTLDNILQGFAGIFIMGKFYMIFSFLFGLSFFIQSSKRDSGFLLRFTWRLLILFAIGMIHHLHYRGDILSIYAILGFGLLLFSWLPDKTMLIVAVLLVFNIPSHIARTVYAIDPSLQGQSVFNADQNALMAYYNTVKSGPYLEILKANFNSFSAKMRFQVEFGRIYITLGLFLLGVYAGRKKVFENLEEKKPLLKKAIRYSLWSLLGVILFAAAFFGASFGLKIELSEQVQNLVSFFTYDVFNAAMSCIYTAGILLLFQKEKWHKRLMHLYPVGRMGLTTYLMQSMFGTLIFFSYGLGLLFEFGSAVTFGLGVLIFIVQIIFAKYWFQYFQFGPVEWLWRTLTYFKIQPLRKKQSLQSVVV